MYNLSEIDSCVVGLPHQCGVGSVATLWVVLQDDFVSGAHSMVSLSVSKFDPTPIVSSGYRCWLHFDLPD